MAMQILMQKNLSDMNVVNKTLQTVADLSGTLRDETSIVDPDILISGDVSTYADCNYMTIPDFGRSYFIRDITSVRTGVLRVSAHVDVLSSWTTQLLTNRGILRRSAHSWNLYLNDGSLRTYQNPDVYTKAFPYSFSGTPSFVLAVAGS